MPCKRKRSPLSFFTSLVVCAVAWISGTSIQKAHSTETLYLVESDPNSAGFVVASEGTICDEPNLVIVTHGWYERRAWPGSMALAVARRVDRRQWQCGWYDWRLEARHLRPSQAATIGRDTAGPGLGEKIAGLSQDWRHVHLIGHSAGAWVVRAAAEIVASRTNAEIHITFLDAYVPDGWDEKALGRLAQEDPNRCWADHYFTRDPFGLTENVLTGVHNVDITAVNPGIRGHLFPWHWYLATIAGRYTTDDRFANSPVFCRTEGTTYGFPRTREAGLSQWKSSLALPPTDRPVRIQRRADRR